MAITFIKARSLSLIIICGPPVDVTNNPLSLSRAQVKLDYCSLDMNANPVDKVNPIDVTPTISSNDNQYLLVF